ncbi:hypothetical protein GCM10010464_64830 [Pseudonocardia yunnanensis]
MRPPGAPLPGHASPGSYGRGRAAVPTRGKEGHHAREQDDLQNGRRLTTWLRTHAATLRVKYVIWQGRFWSPDHRTPTRPYTGGGIYDPNDVTGGHDDHVHLSVLNGGGLAPLH